MAAAGSPATRSQRASQGSRPPAASARVRPTTAGSRWPVSSTSARSASTWAPSPIRPLGLGAQRPWKIRVAQPVPHGLGATGGHRRRQQRALSTVAPASCRYWSPWASTPASRAAASRSSSRPPVPWAARPPPCGATPAAGPRPWRRSSPPRPGPPPGGRPRRAGGSRRRRRRRPPPGQRDQLAGAGVAAGHIDQPAGQPDRPGLERLGGQRRHRSAAPGRSRSSSPLAVSRRVPWPTSRARLLAGRARSSRPASSPKPAGSISTPPARLLQGGRDLGRLRVEQGEESARSCPPPHWSRPGGA